MNLIDYKAYKLSVREYILFGFCGMIITLIFSYLFYQSFIPSLIFIPCSHLYFKQISVTLYNRRRDMLCRQFNDSLLSISTSLETGCSIENAIWEAYLEISVIYSRNSYMSIELNAIYNQLKISIPVEDAFSNLAARTDIEDILVFCEILKIAKRTDGNLVSIIRTTADTISEKLDIKREIKTNINGKKFEQLIMSVMPAFIVIYIRLSSPDFFEPLYNNAVGIIFTTVCLIVYALSVLLSIKITRIEV